MYHALYRKYRPKKLDDVVGQKVIIKTLSNAILNDKVSHAYLFSGPRGTGKTSIAKVFAKMVNCENLNGIEPCNKCVSCTQINNNQNIDVIEIDAASNNGVDEIREIRNKISLVPTNSKYKVYIIDEVHMLTNQAFNALLKTLEEPPAHVIFIFATTEYYKVPKTILSRCQRFDFKKVSIDDIYSRLKYISKQENIIINDDAIYEIAQLSDGGMRDAISLLDQTNSYVNEKICIEDVHEINGTITDEEINKFLDSFFNKDLISILNYIDNYDKNGKDIIKIIQEIIEKLKQLMIYMNTKDYLNPNELFDKFSLKIENEQLYNLIKNLSNSINEMKKSNNVKILFEIEIIKNLNISIENNPEKISTIKKEEEKFECEPIIKQKIEPIKELNNDIKEIQKIRINNSLISFSKKVRDEFKEKIENMKTYLLEPKYSKYISLILDGELKAIADKNFILVYSDELLANEFNTQLTEIETTLFELLNEKYKPIAVSNDAWDNIKNKYNTRKEDYKYIEEPKKEIEKETLEDKKNDIEKIFDDIIEYS